MTSASKELAGSCQCGAVKIKVAADPIMSLNCHCSNCQKSSGAAHVPLSAFPNDKVTITGKTSEYQYKADSGGTATSIFCPKCGSTIAGRTTSFEGVTAVRLGVLDEPTTFAPQMNVYAKRLRSWDHDFAGVPGFPEMPPMPAKS